MQICIVINRSFLVQERGSVNKTYFAENKFCCCTSRKKKQRTIAFNAFRLAQNIDKTRIHRTNPFLSFTFQLASSHKVFHFASTYTLFRTQKKRLCPANSLSTKKSEASSAYVLAKYALRGKSYIAASRCLRYIPPGLLDMCARCYTTRKVSCGCSTFLRIYRYIYVSCALQLDDEDPLFFLFSSSDAVQAWFLWLVFTSTGEM